ncbi:cytochrome P450 2J3-like isoform X4 [Neoarius graeffei]|uniref:cytochrome P450 2J3-like isoform X4 n=1 Tax=Neoarius graeffei TaxID=443677 RepID=UPI00298BCC3C|nr:cytochrome P450 2J3-like isoform X4 [Neoarius graeffei]
MLSSWILAVVCVCLLFLFIRIQRPKNFPPGPQPLPIFGNLFHFNMKNPLKDFEKKQGDSMWDQKGEVRIPHNISGGSYRLFSCSNCTQANRKSSRHWIQPAGELYDALPVVRSLPLPFKKAFDNFSRLKSLTANMINKHKTTRVPGKPRDFVDCYLDELDKRDSESTFSEEQLVAFVMNLHVAGTETTSNTLLTAILYLMVHPDIQKRCQQEIDEVLEGKSEVSFEDRHNMPYIQAVIHECQRVANTVPLSLFHCTTRDTELMNYTIPKRTLIIPNLSSVLSEEGQWKFPHDFNPSNFLNEQGQFEKPEAFLPFSSGPRVCLGESLARMELFLFLVTLLRRFQFIWPEDAREPDFTPVFGLTTTPKPYRMEVRLREPAREM